MDPDQKLLQDQGHPGKNGEISFETKTLGAWCARGMVCDVYGNGHWALAVGYGMDMAWCLWYAVIQYGAVCLADCPAMSFVLVY